MSENPDDLEEVQRRLKEIRQHKRGRIRWDVGNHTAEMALGAIVERQTAPEPKNAKRRRRKRRKRLL